MAEYNWPIVGHKNIVEFLKKSIESDRLAHAFLFHGEKHLGKTTLAENFVSTLLCEKNRNSKKGEMAVPCRSCSNCKQLERNAHPDVIRIRREPDKKNISIEQLREMQNRLFLSSFLDSYKIAIIEEAEALSLPAANSILKILEEPRKKTIIILLASNKDLLPATIVSRCQAIKFLPVPQYDIFQYLTKELGSTRESADIFSHLANGRPGVAINLMRNEDEFKEYEEAIRKFVEIIKAKNFERFNLIEKIVKSKKDEEEAARNIDDLLNNWAGAARDMILSKTDNTENLKNFFIKDEIKSVAAKFSLTQLQYLAGEIFQAKKFIKMNAAPRLAIESIFLKI